MGPRERDSYRSMSNAKQTRRLPRASRETLLTVLETLPGALFVVDDVDTIMYANASAQTLTGATPEHFVGTTFWRCAAQLVSTSLYQAMLKTKQSREPTEAQYRSPITHNWLHVQLSPTDGGLTLQFHEMRDPTQRQETFPQSERLCIDDLDGLHTGIGVLTPEGIVLDINEVPLDDGQVRREEVLGKPLAETPWWSFSPASQEQLRAAIARASTGETVRFETLVQPREGMSLELEATITPHVDADRHIDYLVFAASDITARKQAEREIHALVDAIPQFVWMMHPDGSSYYGNRRWRDYTNMTSQQYQGDGWLQAIHPDDRQRTLEAWQTSIHTGTPFETEQRLRNGTSGAYRWFLARAMPHKDAQGTTLKWVGTSTDIDDRKRAEQQLKASEENLRVLAETVPQLVWTTRPDGLVEYWNQRWYDYSGSSPEQSSGHGWNQFLHPDDYQHTLTVWRHALATGEPYEIEYRLKDGQTGTYRWFLARGTPVRDETGQIVKWFGTCTDIDEQKRTEEALRQSQERASVLMNSSIIGIFASEDEQVVDANDTYLRMTGYTREDLRAQSINWLNMTPPEYLARTQQARQELVVQRYGTPYEKEYICKDGSRLPVVVGVVALRLDPLYTIGFVLDNSARQELEQRKDDFISMAGHELRTPLTALKLQAALLKRHLAKQGSYDPAAAFAKMEAQVNRATELVEELLDVSKIQAGRLEYLQETVDLDALLREITDTMQHIHPSHSIVVRGAVQTSLLGDRDRLGQVFTNLLSNAIKYSPDAKTVEMDLDASPETVTIRVHDHGIGILREQRYKIFERFYRAAGPKQRVIPGLGMGLYIVAEIVKRHGGTITVDSAVGNGSTFTVTLPRKRDA